MSIQTLTRDTLAEFKDWANCHAFLAFDTETTGLDVWAEGFKITHLAVAAEDGTAWVMDAADTDLAVNDVLPIMAERSLYAHNASYDCLAALAFWGVRLHGVKDSVTVARVCNPSAHVHAGGQGYSLKALRPATKAAQRRLASSWAAHQGIEVEALKDGWPAEACSVLPFDHPALLDYVATDAIETAYLVRALRDPATKAAWDRAKAEAALDDAWRFVSQERGYAVDRTALQKALDDIEVLRNEAIETHGIDLTRTTNEVRDWLARRAIVITDRNGKPTLSHKRWDSAKVPPAAQADWEAFKRIRGAAAAANKANELLDASALDGRIYPAIPAMEAITGRQAISKPALQNLTEDLREVLLADPGMVLIGCDLDRVEPRVMAAMTKDPKLRIAVAQEDVYVELAVAVWGEAAREDKAARKKCKGVFLGMLYGMGLTTLADSIKVSENEARSVKQALQDAYPVMTAWTNSVREKAKKGEPLFTAFGRPLPTPQDAPYKAINYLVQGSAKDVLTNATLAVVERLGTGALYLPVHDELIVQVPDTEAARSEAITVLGEAMSSDLDGVPITGTPVVIGDRLRKLEE